MKFTTEEGAIMADGNTLRFLITGYSYYVRTDNSEKLINLSDFTKIQHNIKIIEEYNNRFRDRRYVQKLLDRMNKHNQY